MTQSQTKSSIETASYKMSLKKPSTSNDSTTSSGSDDASDSSSNSSSSSSSEASAKQKPQTTANTKFSILKNDTDSGLRIKIAAVPKSPYKKENTSTETTKTNQKSSVSAGCSHSKGTNENMNHRKARSLLSKKRQRNDSSSNSSCCSACTESDDDSDSSSFCSKEKRPSKATKPFANSNKTEKSNNNINLRRNAGPSRTTTTTMNRKKPPTESSDSDSDSSDDSSDSESNEKRISPSKPPLQKIKNDLLKTVPGVSNQNLNADGASSSDMELPALVRAAIQRVESCSEGENSKTEPIGKTQYTSSLLRDFVTKSQMLGSNTTSNTQKIESKQTEQKKATDDRSSTNVIQNGELKMTGEDTEKTKKKRGRPRKQTSTAANVPTTKNNGSPDSGIISIPQSPVPSRNRANDSPKPNKRSNTTVAKKFDLATFEKNLYATERVLYPPRRKKQSAEPQPMENVSKSTLELSKRNAEKVDPVWRKIDINKKFRRPSECGYRSDTNTICSKVLAAQSGYTTDYGDINRRILSGYKSDYSCKSRRSGYKSDYSVGAKSCGYRSDCSMKHRRRIRRKRRTKTMSTKPTINDQDILMLAGLSLGHSGDDSSSDTGEKDPTSKSKTATRTNTAEKSSNSISTRDNGKLSTLAKISSSQSFGRDASSGLSDRVAKRLNSMHFDHRLSPIMNSSSPLLQITSSIYKDGDPNSLVKLDGIKPGSIRRRRSSAVSHCSSHCSTNSRHPFRRRRRKRLKSTTDQISEPNLAKLNLEIDVLSESFNSSCAIFTEKLAKEKNTQPAKSTSSKRANKKRKTNQENSELAATSINPTSKRRNKKAVQTKSPDDHKLPLKKRHYLMTPGETPANKKGSHETANDDTANDQQSPENEIETVGKAITPKKRHLLQTPVDLNDVIDSTDATSNSTCKDLQEIQASVSIPITNDKAANKTTSQSKKNDVTRKKNRIEGLVSKISPSQQSSTSESSVKSAAASSKSSSVQKCSVSSAKMQSLKSVATLKSITKPASASKTAQTFAQIYESSTSKGGNSFAMNNRSKVDTNINPPPGVFEPSIDVELAIPFTEIPIPMAQKSIDTIADPIKIDSVNHAKIAKGDTSKTTTTPNAERLVEKLLHRTAGTIQTMAKKKRKKPNRTGFPTLKKKKKPISKPQSTPTSTDADQSNNGIHLDSTNDSKHNNEMNAIKTISTTKTTSTVALSNKHKQTCDRVPSDGEAAGTFIERNSKPRLSVINIERLQSKSKPKTNEEKPTVAGRKKNKNDKSNKNYKQNAMSETGDDNDECEDDTKTDTRMANESNGKKECNNEMKNAAKQKTKSHEVETDRKRITVESVGKRGAGVAAVAHTNDSNTNSLITRRNRLAATNQVEHLDNHTSEHRRHTQSKAQLVEKKSRSTPDSICEKANEQSKSKLKRNLAETVIDSKVEKRQKDSIDVKKTNSSDNKVTDRGPKRAVNGRVISSSNVEQSVGEETEIMAAGEINKNGKRIRRDQENKSNDKRKSNKREITADSLVIDGNDKKRPHFDNRELSNSPTKKSSKATSEKPIVKETVTDASEIMPVDDWIERITEEPLPLDENVNKFASITELVPASEYKKSQLKPKKRYLVAGLYSSYYKEDILSHTDKATKALTDKKQLLPTDEIQCESLLPMPFLENYVMRRNIDFCLPWDLWYAHENGKLTGRNIVHSWNFKKIRTNIYADSVKPNQSSDLPQCSCKSEYACGDNCLNRLVYTECEPETCPCGDKCQNTKIQRHIVAPVERFMTPHKGWGVKSNHLIKRGTYILEYVGEVVTEREFKDRMATLYTNDIHHYCLHLDGGLVIDGHRMGSDCRFVNHSCEPNCEIQKWSVNGLSRMALFALRDIQPGEELTYDYNFSLFNPAEGQVCKCESEQCRGVIGGKSQRVRPIEIKNSEKANDAKKGKTKRPKRGGESKSKGFMHSKDNLRRSQIQMPTAKEQYLVANGHCFLLRNLRRMRTASAKLASATQSNQSSHSLTAKISALRVPRNIRTRGVAIAEHDPVIEKTVRIAVILREICEELNSFKDASGQCAITKLNLPSRKKVPQYYEKIKNPIDLSTIEANVEKGVYDKPTIFDDDINHLFSNAIEYYGTESPEATITTQLQTIYARKKTDSFDRLVAICGESSELNKLLETQFGPFLCPVEDPNEDHIRCICGLFRDEGLMIQCSECKIWQHTECTGADTEAEHYMCEKCKPREIDYEIPLKEDNKDGDPYYLSLMRGDLQIRQSDTVYVLRDIPIEGATPDSNDDTAKPLKHTYKTIGEIDYNECDIFRVESLWKDKDGKRFVFGHHYLRPHETFHEPTRKFYRNEVVRVPLYEQVPIELIMGRCWVMDLNTYCKGRPVDSVESHVYICELRVDKAARLFSKNSKNQYPVCTKNYAFKKFRQRLKISRNYMPHEIDSANVKPVTNVKSVTKKRRAADEISNQPAKRSSTPVVQLMPPPQKTMNEKRNRLEGYLSTLMTKKRTLFMDAQPVDLSYLLTGRGARRRTNVTNVPHKI